MRYFSAAAVILLFFSTLSAAQNKAGEQLKALQAKFNSLSDISADFVQYTNGRENISGKFAYKKEGKLRLELKNILVVTDGKTNWSYNKKENKVVISDYDPSDPSVLSLDKFINDYPSGCSVSAGAEKGSRFLTLIPATEKHNFKSAKMFINEKDLVDKLIIEDLNGNLIKVIFSDIKTNSGLSNSKFTFNPPKGSKVIDLR